MWTSPLADFPRYLKNSLVVCLLSVTGMVLSSAIVGYMAFLGLGLPSALVRQVANYSGRGLHGRLWRLIRSAVVAFAVLGLLGALSLALFATGGGLALLSLPEGAEASAQEQQPSEPRGGPLRLHRSVGGDHHLLGEDEGRGGAMRRSDSRRENQRGRIRFR